MTIAEPKKSASLADLHAGAKLLYLDLCAYHVENADEDESMAEIRDLAEQVALKLRAVIRGRVNRTELENDK